MAECVVDGLLLFLLSPGRLQYPVRQSVCGESVRSDSHPGDDAPGFLQIQVFNLLYEDRENVIDFLLIIDFFLCLPSTGFLALFFPRTRRLTFKKKNVKAKTLNNKNKPKTFYLVVVFY